MKIDQNLNRFYMTPVILEVEWVVTIDIPTGGVGPILEALVRDLSIVQGAYDCCTFVR